MNTKEDQMTIPSTTMKEGYHLARLAVVAMLAVGLLTTGCSQESAVAKLATVTASAAEEVHDAEQSDTDKIQLTPRVEPLSNGAAIEDERNTVDIFQSAAPAVVYVTQNQIVHDRFTRRALEVPAGSGTGFIWDDDGHVVTNYHVVDGGQSFTVTLYNQKSYDAELVGGEPRKDIAVLKIDAPKDELEGIRLPRKGYEIEVGQKAIAIGNPFGLDHTLTTGVVSATGREVEGYGRVSIRDMIQTDASINPGNSGGPLINSAGELIGMNTMIFSRSGSSAGIGFAVPEPTIRRIVPQIIETGAATQVGLGVSIRPDRDARKLGISGVIIEAVSDGSPAEEAGLAGLERTRRGVFLGDVIVGIEDEEVSDYDDLYNALDGRAEGDKVDVTLVRDGKKRTVEVELYEIN